MTLSSVRDSIRTLRANSPKDYDHILNCIGDARVVLIGEASHGTHEFYKVRAELTKRLIIEKGFKVIACESDWPDMYRVNRYVTSLTEDETPEEALGNFQRFPRWMWRNTEVASFIQWLKKYNSESLSSFTPMPVGMYGLDLYSLQSSIDEVLKYLDANDPMMAERVREHYACFGDMDSKAYGRKAGMGLTKSCEKDVLQVLQQMLAKQSEMMKQEYLTGKSDDAYFYTLQNAKVVQGAESYYRNIYSGRVNTWNIRDTHMLETLVSLMDHLSSSTANYGGVKAVVWAHNSHLGDASETENKKRGKINLGQLVRQHFGKEKTFNIGFTTFTGSVTAANNWGEDPQFKVVNPGMEGSYEKLFHEVCATSGMNLGDARFSIIFRTNVASQKENVASRECIRYLSNPPRLERAIGVVYRPTTERQSHYFVCNLPRQWDSIIHIDTTEALHPLEHHPQWVKGRRDYAPATYPGVLPRAEIVDSYDTNAVLEVQDVNMNKSEEMEEEEASEGHPLITGQMNELFNRSRRRQRKM